MALKEVEIFPDRFLYRCDDCGFEYPYDPVKRENLGPPPPHDCKQSRKSQLEDIVGG